MTKDEFKGEFKRLCEGFEYHPRPVQLEAFFDRLKHCEVADWREAVTDLLCAPKFPWNLSEILEAIERRAEQRRRRRVDRENHVISKMVENSTSLQDALAEDPEKMAPLLRMLGDRRERRHEGL